MKRLALTVAGLVALVAASSTAMAQFSPKDGQVLGRTLGFVGEGTIGIMVVGVVVSATDPASQRDAEAIRAVIGMDLPTISADLTCVQSRGCVVGFSTEPTVQIVIDTAAATRTGVHFTQAFRMLVRER